MFDVEFYDDKNGNEPVKDFLDELERKGHTSKNDRIRADKIYQFIRVLQEHGTQLGEPYVKHIDGDLWELRPIKDRIFFFYFNKKGAFILLHHFVKKTRKTPPKEIDQAKRNLKDYKERNE